ncbi:MAG: hypothetical protein H0T53_00430 [Herpetosiphonaceae bacterium]|nr:hypothetical protein [Herpetosiphonaceae bacterium]
MQQLLKSRGFLALLTLLIVGTLGGLALWTMRGTASPAPSQPPFTLWLHLADATERNVTVSLDLERDSGGNPILAATYTPTKPGFHLYSIDLPLEGASGLGRPTQLELAAQTLLSPRGPVSTDAVAFPDESISVSQPLLIYPEGPVTLRLPITLPASATPLSERVTVSYMTCNTVQGLCMPPVIGKELEITIPAALLGAAE